MKTTIARIGSATIAGAILTTVLAATAPGQAAQPDDFLVASSTGGSAVLVVTPGANTSRTLANLPGAIRGVVVAADNTNYYAASGIGVYGVTATGIVTTVVPTLAPGIGTAFADLDETGEILVGTGWRGAGSAFRVDGRTGLWSTIAPTGIFANALCLDRDTGDVVIADTTSGSILRVDRFGTVRTVQTGLPTVYCMDFHPRTGDVLIGMNGSILRLDPANTMTTFASTPSLIKSLAVLASGDVVAGPHGTTMTQYDVNGQVVGTPYNGASITKMDLAVEDENNVWSIGVPSPGVQHPLSIRFAKHPGKLYIAAASFGRSPGIPIGSRIVPLTPDNLFGLSQTAPAIFSGFAGSLNANGAAGLRVNIPALPLKGIRMFFAAVVVDPAAPNSIAQISQPYGVTIQ